MSVTYKYDVSDVGFALEEPMIKNTKEVVLVQHENTNKILVRFEYNLSMNEEIKKLRGSRWSRTLKGWLLPDNDYYRDLFGLPKTDKAILSANKSNGIEKNAINEIEQFILWMRNKRYSESTVETYSNAIKLLLAYTGKQGNEITNNDILLFNKHQILEKKLSATYQSQFVNAVKLFHQTVLNSKIIIDDLVRPKRGKQLPKVLSVEEVADILNACKNLKHKSMLSLIYSAGLRRSELLNMLKTDIDSKRMVIMIRNAKGMKDRIVPLSSGILELLREYYKKYKPKEFLFEGQYGGKYSERSLELVLKKAVGQAGIKKNVNLHMLRHSYATHLMEAGTHLRHIQELLGHKSPKTTQIYTHVSREEIGKIISPFDRLKLKK
ncbi:MAG: site-specific tyrosine recombinase/integron integrase [Bacteroidia bacterium]